MNMFISRSARRLARIHARKSAYAHKKPQHNKIIAIIYAPGNLR